VTDIDRYDYAFDPDGDSWAARLLRRLPAKGAVLELGPGSGAMTKVLVARGYEVTVVENDAQALQAMQALGVKMIAGDLEQAQWLESLAGARFDAVLACDVLEHLRNPEALLLHLAGLLRPMGQLVISVPNIAYAGVLAALRNGVFDYADKGILDRTHLRFFTQRSMQTLLLDCGWTPRLWDAHRVPMANSEFAWCWEALPGEQRQLLQSGWPEFDVYQWMVVATPPCLDVHTWEATQARTAAEKLRQELYALKQVYAQEHASLLEHQKAFAEAKALIGQFQQDMQALQAQQEGMQAQHLALQQDNAKLQQKLTLAERRKGLLQRLWALASGQGSS